MRTYFFVFAAYALGAAGTLGAFGGLGCSSSSSQAEPPHDGGGSDATHPKDARAAKDGASPDDAGTDVHEAGCALDPTCHACLATDPDNCGTCGHSCGAGGSCSGGLCTRILATGQGTAPNTIQDLIIDDDRIYWIPTNTDPSSGGVVSVAKAGGALSTVISGVVQPQGLTQDTDTLYFVSHTVGIEKVAKTGGAQTRLLSDGTLDAGLFPEFALVLSAPDLYYVGGQTTGIYDLVLGGSGVPVVVTTTSGIIGAPGTGYNAVAVDTSHIYYDSTSQIVILDRTTYAQVGVVPGSAATGDNFGPTLAIDDTSIYYIANTTVDGGISSAVMRAPIAGGVASLITSSSVSFNDGPMAVDANNVYWSHQVNVASQATEVVSIPKAGGTLQTIATGCYGHCPFAVDAANVYWPSADGTIRTSPTSP
jgi:hypothetical protein